MSDRITSTGDLLPDVLDRLFDSFSTNLCQMSMIETTMMLGNLVTEPEAKRTLEFSIATRTLVMMKLTVNPEDELRTVLSVLDDASLPEFDFCKKEKGVCESINMQSLIGISPFVMDVLANIQINTCVISV